MFKTNLSHNLLNFILFLAVCAQLMARMDEKLLLSAIKTLNVLVNGTKYGDSSSDKISNLDQSVIKPFEAQN